MAWADAMQGNSRRTDVPVLNPAEFPDFTKLDSYASPNTERGKDLLGKIFGIYKQYQAYDVGCAREPGINLGGSASCPVPPRRAPQGASTGEASMVQEQFTSIAVDGGDVRVHFHEVGPGDGPPLILMQTGGHGTSAGMCWYRNFDAFERAGYHVLAPDAPGFGQTEALARRSTAYSSSRHSWITSVFRERT